MISNYHHFLEQNVESTIKFYILEIHIYLNMIKIFFWTYSGNSNHFS
jgi:hypothetical protein